MDDFIDKVAWGLNLVFCNGVGYPRTSWLVRGGARDELAFKDYLRVAPGADARLVLGLRPADRAEHPAERAHPRRAAASGDAARVGAVAVTPRPRATSRGSSPAGTATCRAAAFLLLGIEDAAAARRWLGDTAGAITSAEARPDERALNLAFTSSGLARLGLPAGGAGDVLERVRRRHDHAAPLAHPRRPRRERARAVGVGRARAARGSTSPLLLYARDAAGLQRLEDEQTRGARARRARARAPARHVGPRRLRAVRLPRRDLAAVRRGPLEDRARPRRPSAPGSSSSATRTSTACYTDRPLLDAAADPAERAAARRRGLRPRRPRAQRQLPRRPPAAPGRARVLALPRPARRGAPTGRATRRRGSGSPRRWSAAGRAARRSRSRPTPTTRASPTANDFGYHELDPRGARCPVGAHIRRSHPRDSLDPRPGIERLVGDQPPPPHPAPRPRVRARR